MRDALPLSALLSQALVAFTIEFDNEFEHQASHRTTNFTDPDQSRSEPWLASMVMWVRFMQFVPEHGIPAGDLRRLTQFDREQFQMWATRMSQWWGYISVEKPAGSSPATWSIRPTAPGQRAIEVWRPLTGLIEERWSHRFSSEHMAKLREALQLAARVLATDLPLYLPILRYGLMSTGWENAGSTKPDDTLPILLGRVLLAFAVRFEEGSGLSLAICANLLRLARDSAIRVRNLPRLSGVSKEAIAMMLGQLEKLGFAVIQPESPGSRIRCLQFTPDGQRASKLYSRSTHKIETEWKATLGEEHINALRRELEKLVGTGRRPSSPLFAGLEPYRDGWRALVPKADVLPHYPMLLHRGGFPDGS